MRNKRKRTPVTILLLAGMILSLLTGCGSEPVENKPETVTESSTESASLAEAEAETPEETKPTVRKKIAAFNYEKAAEYLFDYYGIEPDQEETLENINGMIRALGGEEIEADDLSDAAIIKAGIKIAGLDELAQTYVNSAAPDKATKVLTAHGLSTEPQYAPYVACAVDLDLYANRKAFDIETFFYRCMEIAGKGRRYIGRVSDADLMEELRAVLDSMSIFDNWELSEVGTKLVIDGTVTGYGLKYSGYDARFLDPYTLKYSHSDYQHAVQLVGLLRSEGMDAYIQIEPKVSIYEYLKEWGTPPIPSPTYAVQQTEEGRYLCYSIEYDLMIEFDSEEAKEKFHSVIETYAKKYDDRVDENGNATEKLLAESWWQPLYSSGTPMQNREFQEMIDNVVYDKTGKYSIHTFTLPQDAAAVVNKVTEIAPKLEISPYKVYVNPAFIRYITGEDHQ